MGQGYLLDSNAIIDFCGGKLPSGSMQKMSQIVDAGFHISSIVKIETLGFNGSEAGMQRLESFIALANMVYIDNEVIKKTIDLRKAQKVKLGDAIIAATAIVSNFDLLSHNLADFKNIPNLIVIDPYTL